MVVPYECKFSLSAFQPFQGPWCIQACGEGCGWWSARYATQLGFTQWLCLESRSNSMYHECIRYMSCNKILWTHSIEFYTSYGFGLCKIWRVQHIQTNRAAYWGFPMQTLTNIYAAGQNSVLGAGGNGAMPKGLSKWSIHVWIGIAAMFPTPNHCSTPAHRRTSISQHNELPF